MHWVNVLNICAILAPLLLGVPNLVSAQGGLAGSQSTGYYPALLKRPAKYVPCSRGLKRVEAGKWSGSGFVSYSSLIRKLVQKQGVGPSRETALEKLRKKRRQYNRVCRKGAPGEMGVWQGEQVCLEADLTHDGQVDFADLFLHRRSAGVRSGANSDSIIEIIVKCWGAVQPASSGSSVTSSDGTNPGSLSSASSSSSRSLDLGDLNIPLDRIPDWSGAGVEGGIPDTTTWPSISALDFGAVPDDGLDDSAAINAAINSAAGTKRNTVVSLPQGTFNLIQPQKIQLKSHVVLQGQGPEHTLIVSSKGSAPSNGVEFRGSEQYERFAVSRIGTSGGKTTLSVSGFDFENLYPGFALESGSRISIQASTGLDCNGDGQWETAWSSCSQERVAEVQGDTITLTEDVIMEVISQTVPDMTCAELGGSVCAEHQFCGGTMSITSDSERCCNERKCHSFNFLVYPYHRPVSGLERGSRTLGLTQAPIFGVGDYILVSQANDTRIAPNAWFAAGIGQIVRVTAVGPASVEITPAIRESIDPAYDPRLTRFNLIESAGVEDLRIEFGDVTPVPLYQGDVFSFSLAVNCWLRNVFARNAYAVFVGTSTSAHLSIVDSFFQKIQKPDYTNTYALSFGGKTSDSIAANNILDDVWVTGLLSGSANGNVYSYNFETNIRADHGIFHHGTYPFENLVEGNHAYRITHDRWWGRQGPRITYFRNRASEIRTSLNGWEEDIVADQLNVLANSANYFLSYPWCTYPDRCFAFDRDTTNMWAERNVYRQKFIGLSTPGESTTYLENELGESAPISWAGVKIPASLYLSGPPGFWCAELPWPAIGADVDDYANLNKLPAQRRYEGLPCTPLN